MLKRIAIFLIGLSVLFTSCKKEEDTDSTPSSGVIPGQINHPIIQPNDANGTLVAIQTSRIINFPGIGTKEVAFWTAVAVFYDDPGSGIFVPAGTVKCESGELAKQSDNTYIYIPSQSATNGLEFNGDIDWEVSGFGNVATIMESIDIGIPAIGGIISDSLIKKTEDYTLEASQIYSVDSVIWIIGNLIHTTAGGQNSYTFTKEELSTLDAGANVAQIVGYRFISKETDGKNYYYINEDVKTKQVELE